MKVDLLPVSSGSWQFTKDELLNSPSQTDGMNAAEEARLRNEACTFIQTLGLQLSYPQLTISTALLFYHRFYAIRSHQQFPYKIVSISCIFCAGKLEETPRKLKEVLGSAPMLLFHRENPSDDDIRKLRDQVCQYERELLEALGFDFRIEHPYKYILSYLKQLNASNNTLAQASWNIANDSYKTTVCVQASPQDIAAASIFLAAKLQQTPLNSLNTQWKSALGNCPQDILDDISHQLLDLYESSSLVPKQEPATKRPSRFDLKPKTDEIKDESVKEEGIKKDDRPDVDHHFYHHHSSDKNRRHYSDSDSDNDYSDRRRKEEYKHSSRQPYSHRRRENDPRDYKRRDDDNDRRDYKNDYTTEKDRRLPSDNDYERRDRYERDHRRSSSGYEDSRRRSEKDSYNKRKDDYRRDHDRSATKLKDQNHVESSPEDLRKYIETKKDSVPFSKGERMDHNAANHQQQRNGGTKGRPRERERDKRGGDEKRRKQ